MIDFSALNIFWRDLQLIELDCGRKPGWNPIFSNAITIYRAFDNSIGQFRPLAVPVTQIIDPFNEVSFHNYQSYIEQGVFEPKLLHISCLFI